MKNYLSHLDDTLLRMARQIGEEAGRRQCRAYMVGGIVRDLILKRKNFDLDIVVDGDAISLAKALAGGWGAKMTAYKKFGTASLKTSKGLCVDFAMARQERYPHSGALPVVRPGSLKEDFFRRDFTVNAMAIAVNPGCFGRLVDEFGGLADLSRKTIRVLHDQSFVDDPTRILRAVRFEQRFSFRMEPRTLRLIKEAQQRDVFLNVKPPRYFTEFKKILRESDPLKCLKRLHQLGGLRFIDPGLRTRIRDLGLMHQRICKARKKSIYNEKDWWLVYFMGIIARADDRMVKCVLAKFPFTKNERASIQHGRETVSVITKLSEPNLRPSQTFRILRPLKTEVVLYLRVAASPPIVSRRIDRFFAHDAAVRLCIDGEDLKKMGVASGGQMGKILEHVLCLKIDKKISTKREELRAAALCSRKP